jgi:4-hydroxybenzoate polyprenyltransferase
MKEGIITSPAGETVHLVVDLDGTLVNTDLLFESFFSAVTLGVRHHVSVLAALLRGKAELKAYLAKVSSIDYGLLPYDQATLSLIRKARAEGRQVYLATSSDQRHAEAVAAHLGLFDGVFASDGTNNLSGEAKARRLVESFGARRFDYIGNDHVDLAIWAQAHKAYTISAKKRLRHKVEALGVLAEHIGAKRPSIRTWMKALRVQQYAKNVLVFVPLLTAHAFSSSFVLKSWWTFLAFSLCASSVYLINDLVDLDADRRHPDKKNRPFASGELPIVHGIVAIPLLLGMAVICALAVSVPLLAVLTAYFALTLAYSLSLKRKLLVDVIVLAMLYTIRVVAGAVALPVVPSTWLLAFSMFSFTFLALIKRYAELAMRIDMQLQDPSNRNYRLADLPIVGSLAAASGVNAITIFALYINSPAVGELYRRPEVLWAICPILLYWFGRALVMAHRRYINEDPILFVLRDHVSILAGGLIVLIMLLAI